MRNLSQIKKHAGQRVCTIALAATIAVNWEEPEHDQV